MEVDESALKRRKRADIWGTAFVVLLLIGIVVGVIASFGGLVFGAVYFWGVVFIAFAWTLFCGFWIAVLSGTVESLCPKCGHKTKRQRGEPLATGNRHEIKQSANDTRRVTISNGTPSEDITVTVDNGQYTYSTWEHEYVRVDKVDCPNCGYHNEKRFTTWKKN